MGQNTEISWTDATWNPVIGCRKVSEGCRNCYAESVAARFHRNKNDDDGLGYYSDVIKWDGYKATGWNGHAARKEPKFNPLTDYSQKAYREAQGW
jgi:protein gp37